MITRSTKRSLEAEMTHAPYSNADSTEPRTPACRFDKNWASLNASKGDVENAESWLTKLKNPERLGGSGLSLY